VDNTKEITNGTLPNRQKLTPPEIAKAWGIDTGKVLTWIREGELRAINAATSRSTRPRFLVDVDDLLAFERSREVVSTPPKPRTRRKAASQVRKYF